MTTAPVPTPDAVYVQHEPTDAFREARRTPQGWEAGATRVTTGRSGGATSVFLASAVPVSRIALRWRTGVPERSRVFGDAWERTYGDVLWDTIRPHRILPWLWIAIDEATAVCMGAGVRTGARAWCSWTVDVDGVTL